MNKFDLKESDFNKVNGNKELLVNTIYCGKSSVNIIYIVVFILDVE
jgi:hypothetical protein